MKKIYLLLLLGISLLFVGCGRDEDTIYIGATAVPHAEILEIIKSDLEELGYKLKIKVYSDYVLPNVAVWKKDLDANFFQHLPYLNDYNEKNNTNLVGVLAIHFEPFGIYSNNHRNFDDVEGATIVIPNDPTNCARALLLLDSLGLLTVDKTKGLATTKRDITDNPNNIEIVELEAASLPAQLASADFAIINGNYALTAKIPVEKQIASEDPNSLAAETYANYIVVRFDKTEDPKTLALIEVLSSTKIREFIEETYPGAVVPIV